VANRQLSNRLADKGRIGGFLYVVLADVKLLGQHVK